MPELYSWWEPNGWIKHPVPPEPYKKAFVAADVVGWHQSLMRAGYHHAIQYGDEIDYYQVEVWKHDDGHLYVDVASQVIELAQFFVAQDHAVEFMVDRLPKLLSEISLLSTEKILDESLKHIRRLLIAFVRYGHGTSTVSEDGETADDQRRHERQGS